MNQQREEGSDKKLSGIADRGFLLFIHSILLTMYTFLYIWMHVHIYANMLTSVFSYEYLWSLYMHVYI